MGGYAFARLPFPGRDLAFYLVVLGLLVPFFTYMIPLYFQLRSMGMLDSLVGVNLVLASTGLSFGTFFMRAFFADLPIELEQAARMDGASELQIFLRVMLPAGDARASAPWRSSRSCRTGTTSWCRCSTCPAVSTGR